MRNIVTRKALRAALERSRGKLTTSIEELRTELDPVLVADPESGDIHGTCDPWAIAADNPLDWRSVPPDFTIPVDALWPPHGNATPEELLRGRRLTFRILSSGQVSADESCHAEFPVASSPADDTDGTPVYILRPFLDTDGEIVCGEVRLVDGASALRFSWWHPTRTMTREAYESLPEPDSRVTYYIVES